MSRIDLETRLRRELVATSGYDDFDGASADVSGLTNEALDLCISVCQQETGRDTTIWIVDPSAPEDRQQANGIRLSVRYRGYIRSTMVPLPGWMKQAGWLRTTFQRPRGSSDGWIVTER